MDETPKFEPSQPRALVAASPHSLPGPEVLEVSAQEVPHLLDYLHVILKRRWTVALCLLIVFSTVAIGTLRQKPIYQGKALIEINPEQPNVLNFKEVLQIDTGDADSYRETQYKVLQSRTLAARVVSDLKLYRLPEFYRKRSLFGLLESDPEGTPYPPGSAPPNPSSDAYENSLENFLDSVDVEPVRRSDLVKVLFYSHDPSLAAQVANQLASDYIDQNLQVKWDQTNKASEWLQGKLVGLKGKLEKSEDALQAYARANSILFVEEKKNLVNARLEQLQQEHTKAQAERFAKESQYNLVQAGKIQDLPGFLSNKLTQDLALRLADLQREYAEMTATVRPGFPQAAALKRQIDTVQAALDRQKSALAQNIVDEYHSAAANERYLAEALQGAKREVNDVDERSIQYNILKREVDTNKQLYEGLLQRMKEAQISAGLNASNIRIVDEDPVEVPRAPVKPRLLLDLVLGVVLGLGLGVVVAILHDYLDDALKTPDEVEHFLRLPCLGVVPLFSPDGIGRKPGEEPVSIVTQRGGRTPDRIQTDPGAVEAFRSLRTSILLSAPPVPKTFLITSAVPGEGKTTIAVNLGATLASLGSRVAILDCDMRRPACHRFIGVSNKPGFVECLTGHVELSRAILAVPAVPNLSVIPCGPIPPNSAELLSSPLAAELLRKLRAEFDYVLVDSPPVMTFSDARILSPLVDVTVLVARANETPYGAVRQARAMLCAGGARILGLALNVVDVSSGGYGYYYRYGYGYGYRHSDGYEQEAKTR